MRESNYTFPQQNRATVFITPRLYDRRALDTNAPLPSLNNLTSLTYLTSTSPQIREVLTIDGGLERLLDILRDSTLPRPVPAAAPDIWGFGGPASARDISLDQQIAVRHSLAFQCVVNIGVRGTEAIRTRVVQAGALDLVAQMLESWLVSKGVYIHACAFGSQAAVQAAAQGRPYGERRKAKVATQHEHGQGHSSRRHRGQSDDELAALLQELPPGPQTLHLQQQHQLFGHAIMSTQPIPRDQAQTFLDARAHALRHGLQPEPLPVQFEIPPTNALPTPASPFTAPAGNSPIMIPQPHSHPEVQTRRRGTVTRAHLASPVAPTNSPASSVPASDEVEMEDGEREEREMTPPVRPATGGGERPMQVDDLPEPSSRNNLASSLDSSTTSLWEHGVNAAPVNVYTSYGPPPVPNAPNPNANPAITPRARQGQLPMAIPIPVHASTYHNLSDNTPDSRVSSAGNSFSGVEDEAFAEIPRASSSASGGSSTANESVMLDRESNETINPGPSRRRDQPRVHDRIPQLVEADDALSTQSSPMGTPTRMTNPDGMRVRRGTVTGRPPLLGIGMFGAARPGEGRRERLPTNGSGTSAGEDPEEEPRLNEGDQLHRNGLEAPEVAIVEQDMEPQAIEEPDAEIMAAAQAAQDLFDGAPPGQPGTGVNDVLEAATPRIPVLGNLMPGPVAQAQIITATGAPRGFPDLASFLNQRLEEPNAEHEYGDQTVLVALQLLAYLSKYPHVRSAFYDPHRPMHPTFNYDRFFDEPLPSLPQRPASSQTDNIFCLVERFRFRPNPQDPVMYVIPQEIQYWAGVIMRNACRKDDKRGGLRQCANMSCGRWEHSPREFAKCRRCRKAKYCSKECQSQAWAEGHRFWCDVKNEEQLMHGSNEMSTPAFATPEGGRTARGARPRREVVNEAPAVPEWPQDDIEMDGVTAPPNTAREPAPTGPPPQAQPQRRSVWAQARNLITVGGHEATAPLAPPRGPRREPSRGRDGAGL